MKDNGTGFNQAYADNLFAPFVQLHSGNDFPGIGIGLAIIQRTISRHEGEVWAENRLGEGATFYFALN